MTDETSIGPQPSPNDARKTQATTEGVDAQNANEFDMQHGLAGAEAKPFAKANDGQRGASALPDDDPGAQDPDERSDMISERETPGLHGVGGDRGRNKP